MATNGGRRSRLALYRVSWLVEAEDPDAAIDQVLADKGSVEPSEIAVRLETSGGL